MALACVPFVPPTAIADVARGDLATFEGTYADGIASLNGALLDEAESHRRPAAASCSTPPICTSTAPCPAGRRSASASATTTPPTRRGCTGPLYGAFGHIHDPQLLPGGTVTGRYAGSLIPIDFGEQDQIKQAVVVDIGRDVVVRSVALPGGRPLTRVDGDLDTLLGRAADGGLDGHLLEARVLSDDPIPDLVDQLLAASPHCDVFDLVNVVGQPGRASRSTPTAVAGEEPSLGDLFAEWRSTAANVGQREAPDDAVAALFEAARRRTPATASPTSAPLARSSRSRPPLPPSAGADGAARSRWRSRACAPSGPRR